MSSILHDRGTILEVDLNPPKGREMKKLRPCLIISVNAVAPSGLRIIVPITSLESQRPDPHLHVEILVTDTYDATNGGLDHDSFADVFHVRCLSTTERFKKPLARLKADKLEEIVLKLAGVIGVDFDSP